MHGQNPPTIKSFLLTIKTFLLTIKSFLLHHHLPQLPEEILFEEILPRLPVKSLLRFRCVSKSWLSLIESDRFIKTQYHNSRKNPSWAHHRVIYDDYRKLEDCSLRRLLTSNEGTSSIDDCTTRKRPYCFVVGCYNGVVCLFDYSARERKRLLLWNPSTRNSAELPTMRGGGLMGKCGFGWDQSRGVYKVVAVITVGDKHTGCVYSSETDSWKAVTGTYIKGCFGGSGLFAGGSLHWLHNGQHGIESFDLEREAFGTIELPPSAAKRFRLGEIGGSLAILFEGEKMSSEVWVMKEYGVKDSWFKLLTFPWDKLMMNRLRSQFGEGPNGEILLVSEAGFIVYSPKDASLTAAKHGISLGTLHVYVESLVSPRRKKLF